MSQKTLGFFEKCERGWEMLDLFQRTNPDDLQALTLAKGHCANTVRHLMEDERSTQAVDAAIAFGEGRISREELDIACDAAHVVCAEASSSARVAAVAASSRRMDAGAVARCTSGAAYAISGYKGVVENEKQTADICRKYLPLEFWNLTAIPEASK